MFDGFAHVWTPLTEARRVRQRPVRLFLAGEPLVLFRNSSGALACLIDRCPHRGVALSLGAVGADGCIECPFHGWRFDASGQNRHVPLNPDAKRDILGAIPVPVREIGGLIWVYTAPGASAPSEPAPPEGMTGAHFTRIYLERIWSCHWTRAMENMLDSPHLPFVHRATIGRDYRSRMTTSSRMEVTWTETPEGGLARAILDGVDNGGVLEFRKPNIMVLHIPIPGRHFRIHALVIPVDAKTTRMALVGSRDFARARLFNPFFTRSNLRILNEDRAVVESSQPTEIPPPGQERSVRTDQATLAFRKYYFDALKPSRAVPA